MNVTVVEVVWELSLEQEGLRSVLIVEQQPLTCDMQSRAAAPLKRETNASSG